MFLAPSLRSQILVDRDIIIPLFVGMKFKGLLIAATRASLQSASVDDLTFTLNDAGTEYSVSDCLDTATGSLDIPSVYNRLQ